MTRGIATIALAPDTRVTAPRSGLHLGRGTSGPVTLRLFRHSGTRVAAVSALVPVQLLAARAAQGGLQVRVLTARPRHWQPLLAGRADAAAVPPNSELPAPTGPSLVVDDRPEETRRLGDTVAWRCRIDIRTPASGADLRTLIGADLLLVGGLLPDLALAATSGMGVSVPHLSQLTAPAAGTVTVLRRGGIDQVSLDPTAEELQLLDQTG
jgi:hypothetical protein